MEYESKTRAELINELVEARQKISGLESFELERKKMEEELLLHSEILKNISEGIYLIRTSDGIIVYSNPKFDSMFGYGPEELIGKHVSLVNAPGEKSPEETAKEIIKSLNENDIWSGEVKNVKKDGTLFWCHANVSTFNHPEYGEVWVSVHEDITKQKEAEKELQKHYVNLEKMVKERTVKLSKINKQLELEIEERKRIEEELQKVNSDLMKAQQITHVGSWTWDLRTDQVRWTDEMYRIYGLERRDTLTAEAIFKMTHPDDVDRVQKNAQRGLREGRPIPIEYRILQPNKTLRVVYAEGNFEFDKKGKPIRMIGTIHDITDKKQSEKEIERLAKFPSENPNPVLRISNESTILYANDASKPVLDVWNSKEDQFMPFNWKKLITECLDSGQSRMEEIKTGDRIFSFVMTPVAEANYVNLYGRDITERKKAEEALRKSEERYKELAESISDSFYAMDKDLRFTFWNKAHENLTGINAETAIGKSLFELFPKVYGTKEARVYQDVLKTEKAQYFEYEDRLYSKDHVYGMSVYPTTDGCSVFAKDITERKKTEKALQESKERYKELADSITDVFFAMDKDLRYTYWNKASEKLTGITAKESVGKSLYEIFPNIKGTKAEKAYLKVLRSGKKQFFEIKYQIGNMDYIFEMTAYPTTDGCSVFTKDITERKAIENELLQQREEQQIILDSVPAMIFFKDKEDRFIRVNDALSKAFNLSKEEIIGNTAAELSPTQEKEYWEDDKQIMASGQPKRNIIEPVATSEGTKWVRTDKIPYKDEKGNIIGIIGFSIDITELKRLEEQLQIRQRMDSLGTLAGGIAHDFNNLLVGIMGYIDMISLHAENLTETQKNYIQNALKSSQRAADLVSQLQTLSRGVVSKQASVDVYEIAEEVFRMLSKTTDRLIKKEIQMIPGEYYVIANGSELNQVFLNLGTNSVQSIEDKGKKSGDYVRVSANDYIVRGSDITGLPDGEYVHIKFEDNGGGMSEEVKRKAFDPLFTTKEKGGTRGQGLGLAMVFNIITSRSGGHIDIESEEDKGTVFHIYLPKGQSEEKSGIDEQVRGGDETVLIIEDEEQVSQLAETLLEGYGYKVLTAADGEEGLKIYARGKETIDIVLLDLTMPKMSGQMVFERIRSIIPDVNIIICSGQSDEDIREGILSNAKGFLKKPYRINDLARTVRKVLDA